MAVLHSKQQDLGVQKFLPPPVSVDQRYTHSREKVQDEKITLSDQGTCCKMFSVLMLHVH